MEYKYGDITSVVIAASMEVHNQLGNGFPEVIYQRALEWELRDRQIVYLREVSAPVYYKGEIIRKRRVDFLIHHHIC